jgi:DNA-binding transcriptional regulator YhcF (GntR family)
MKLIKPKSVRDVLKEKCITYDVIPSELRTNRSISGEAKDLYIALWNSNNGKGKDYKEWKPTTQSLATQYGVDKRTIKRWLKELKDSGWISTLGVKNDTKIIINIEPVLGTKMSPSLGTEMSPYTNTIPTEENSPAEIETNILTIADGNTVNNGTSENVDLDFSGDYTEQELPW